MTSLQGIWRNIRGQNDEAEQAIAAEAESQPTLPAETPDLDIAPNDPLLAYVQQMSGVLEVNNLQMDSPALHSLREAGIKLVVPLVSQGELIGLINLGPRLSEQEYSSDDRKLLGDLAGQAAPALRVAQLVREQQLQVAEQERLQQELRVASLIQQTLLPQDVPQLEGWGVTAYYQPAREVGGDFYDFIYFPDGKVGFIVADVTDKGVPAALVMATTRSILRAAAERLKSPGAVLERTNDLLHPEIPPKMFVTCFYALLDPSTGQLTYANAGHDVPYRYTSDGIKELRATGMPLGLMPGMEYEEKQATLAPGEYVLLYSDGLVEAHDPDYEMFGFPRLQELMGDQPDGAQLKEFLLEQLDDFTGPGWEQEDDVTLVTFQRAPAMRPAGGSTAEIAKNGAEWQQLITFELPSEPGNERQAMERVAEATTALPLSDSQVDRMKTAVAESTMNAMEHGNSYDAGKPVHIDVRHNETTLQIHIRDQGGRPVVMSETATPDLEAKLAGEQSPRGWGLFLIKNMVDEMNIQQDESGHTIELGIRFGEQNGE